MELAREAQVIITMLPSIAAAKEVVFGQNGVLSVLTQEHVLIEMSTLDLGTVLALSDAVTSRGASFLDAPVSGTPEIIERRDGEILASGKKETVDECMEIFNAFTKKVVYVGKVGNGKAMKLCSNMLIALNKLAVTETVTFALKLGIEPRVITEVIKGSNGNSVVFERYGTAAIAGNEKISKKHSWQRTDLSLVLETARQKSIELKLGDLAQKITQDASDQAEGAEDFECIRQYFRRAMNLE